jgi:hypothetical protein
VNVIAIRRKTGEKPAAFTWFFVALLAAAVAAAFASSSAAIAHEALRYPWSRGLPVAVLTPSAVFPRRVAGWLAGCAIAEALALFAIAHLLARRPAPARAMFVAIAIAVAVMSSLAWRARGSTSVDPYTYQQYGKARSFAAAYAPAANEPLPPGFGAPGVFAGALPAPCVYGPLWLVADRALLAAARTQAEGFARLRVAGIVEFALFLALLGAAGVEASTLLVIALCPPLYQYFIVEAHNDLCALAILAAASAILRTPARRAAVAVASCAALIKLNFALLALATLARPQSPRERAGEAIALVTIAVGASLLFAGMPYVMAIRTVASHRAPGMPDAKFFTVEALKAGAAAIGGAAILIAFARDRWWRGAAWTIPALASATWPWYATWPLPFALRIPGFGAAFVASLPVAALALEHAVTMGLKIGLVSLYFGGAIALALANRSALSGIVRREFVPSA